MRTIQQTENELLNASTDAVRLYPQNDELDRIKRLLSLMDIPENAAVSLDFSDLIKYEPNNSPARSATRQFDLCGRIADEILHRENLPDKLTTLLGNLKKKFYLGDLREVQSAWRKAAPQLFGHAEGKPDLIRDLCRIEEILNTIVALEEDDIVLGEYIPAQKRIILYYKAIIASISPLAADIAKIRRRDFSPDDLGGILKTAFSIVLAHEYFHAVHHHNGDFANADNQLKESMARYFELLYCSSLRGDSFAEKYALNLRGRMKPRRPAYPYRGALAFDSLLGESLPSPLDLDAGGSAWLNMSLWQNDILAPRYSLLKNLFINSCYVNFAEIYREVGV